MSGLASYNPDLGIYELGPVWTVSNGVREMRCIVTTHPAGWELRVESKGEMVRTQVCRTQDETLDTADAWKAEAVNKGWTCRH